MSIVTHLHKVDWTTTAKKSRRAIEKSEKIAVMKIDAHCNIDVMPVHAFTIFYKLPTLKYKQTTTKCMRNADQKKKTTKQRKNRFVFILFSLQRPIFSAVSRSVLFDHQFRRLHFDADERKKNVERKKSERKAKARTRKNNMKAVVVHRQSVDMVLWHRLSDRVWIRVRFFFIHSPRCFQPHTIQ